MKIKHFLFSIIFALLFKLSGTAQTWVQVPSGVSTQLNSIFLQSPNTIYTAGNLGVGLKTIDGGNSWNQMNVGVANHNAVRFINPNTGFIAGANLGILKTTDGGSTWAYISGGSPALYDLFFTDSVSGWAVGAPEMGFGTLFTPTLMTFIQINAIAGKNLNGIWFTNSMNGWVVGYLGTIIRTVNGGTTWLPQTSNTTESLSKIMFIDATTGITVGFNGTIMKTTDGGSNWNQLTSGTMQNLHAVYYADINNVWACGDSGIILHSSDAGQNWNVENSGTGVSLRSIHGIGTSDVYACGLGGVIIRRTNLSTIQETTLHNNFSIYPCPASQYATIEFENLKSEIYSLSLYNCRAQLVRKVNDISSNNIQIERGALENGLYLFRINDNEQTVCSGKLQFE